MSAHTTCYEKREHLPPDHFHAFRFPAHPHLNDLATRSNGKIWVIFHELSLRDLVVKSGEPISDQFVFQSLLPDVGRPIGERKSCNSRRSWRVPKPSLNRCHRRHLTNAPLDNPRRGRWWIMMFRCHCAPADQSSSCCHALLSVLLPGPLEPRAS